MIRRIYKHPHEGKKIFSKKNKIWLANFNYKCYNITMFCSNGHLVFDLDLHLILPIDFAVKNASCYNQIPLLILS